MINGKTILMIGGMHALARGIGATLEAAGAQVIYAAHDGPADTHAVNLDDPALLAEQIAALGPLHGVVLSPGWYAFADVLDTTPADWDAAISQNYTRLIYAGQAAARHLIQQGRGGRLVYLSSVASLTPLLQTGIVGVTTTMLWGTARMAAVDLAPQGITVNVVAAGWTESEWTRPYLHEAGRALIEAGIPAGRLGMSGEVGQVVAFLLSDAAAYVTGAIIPVDGGYSLTSTPGDSPYPPSRPV